LRLKQPLLKLHTRYCAETLSAEVRALPPSAWLPHPGSYPGNDAVPLIGKDGQPSNAFYGRMMPTEHLRHCPYIMEIMADIGAVWGRSRLMGLAPGAEVPPHVDVHYHWRTHIRVHIPVITNPGVVFTVGGKSVHMAPGECWTFDSFMLHDVQNRGSEKRVHLVLDTVGGGRLWDLIKEAEAAGPDEPEPDVVQLGQGRSNKLAFEQYNAPGVMSPWEVRCHLTYIQEQAPADPLLDQVFRRMDKFAEEWNGAWAQFGPSDQGVPTYQNLLSQVQRDLKTLPGAEVKLPNAVPVARVFQELIFTVALPMAPAVRSVGMPGG
jgi:hypothetical protein